MSKLTYLRPSALNNIRNCPGYLALMGKGSGDTDATRTGTLGHRWLEQWVTGGLKRADHNWPLDCKEISPIAMDEKDLWLKLHRFAKYMAPKIEKIKEKTKQILVEGELIQIINGCELRGHTDVAAVNDKKGMVLDWKCYMNPLYLKPINWCLQMQAYAWLLAKTYNLNEVTVWRCMVYQHEIHSHKFTEKDLNKFENELLKITEIVKNETKFNHGAHCEKCILNQNCPEFKEKAIMTEELIVKQLDTITTKEQWTIFAQGVGALKKMIRIGEERLRKFVLLEGPLEMPDGKRYCQHIGNGEIMDDYKVLTHLIKETSLDDVLKKIKLTKKAVSELSEESGRNFNEELRSLNAVKVVPRKRWGWRK